MALKITDYCTDCGACEPECPNGAIYEGGENWKLSDATNLVGIVQNLNKKLVNADSFNEPLSDDTYYIVEDKCTECINYTQVPQCVAVCPVEAFEKSKIESKEELLEKINWLFGTETPYESCPVYFENLDNKSYEPQKEKSIWGRIIGILKN